MSAGASDIQQIVSKTQAVERLYQTQKQQPDTDQQKFAATIQQKMLDKNEKAQETAKSENEKILKDRKDKLTLNSKKKRKKQHNKKNTDKKSETQFNTEVGQIIDIKV